MLSETKRNRPRPLRRIRRRTSYPLPFGLDGMAGAGRPARLRARPRPLSWYVLLLMALYVPAGWVVSRLRGWPRPDRKTGCKAVLYPALCAWGWAFGGCGLLLLFSGREALFPPRLHGLCPPGPLLSAGQPFRPVHAPHPGSALRLPEGRRGKRLFQSSAWFAAMFLAGLLPPMLFFLGSLLPKKRLTTAKKM